MIFACVPWFNFELIVRLRLASSRIAMGKPVAQKVLEWRHRLFLEPNDCPPYFSLI